MKKTFEKQFGVSAQKEIVVNASANWQQKWSKIWPMLFVGLIMTLSLAQFLMNRYWPAVGSGYWACQDGQWRAVGNVVDPQPRSYCLSGPKVESGASSLNEGDLIIYEPAPNAQVANLIHVKGRAKDTWFKDKTFQILLEDSTGQKLATSTASASSEIIVGQLTGFEADLKITKPVKGLGFIVLIPQNLGTSSIARLPLRLGQEQTTEISVFFVRDEYLAKNQNCEQVQEVKRELVKSADLTKEAILQLILGTNQAERSQGLSSLLNNEVKLQSLEIVKGTAIIDFNEALIKGLNSGCQALAMRSQIEETLKSLTAVQKVLITVNGKSTSVLQ